MREQIEQVAPAGELALGKLFGAPVLMYFNCLWLTPLTMYAAIVARGRPLLVLAAYVVLLVASVTFHTFTLLLSLLVVRGSQLSSILLALLVLSLGSVVVRSMSSVDFAAGYFRIHSIGPFEAEKFATDTHFTFRSSDGKEFLDDEFADISFFPAHSPLSSFGRNRSFLWALVLLGCCAQHKEGFPILRSVFAATISGFHSIS